MCYKTCIVQGGDIDKCDAELKLNTLKTLKKKPNTANYSLQKIFSQNHNHNPPKDYIERRICRLADPRPLPYLASLIIAGSKIELGIPLGLIGEGLHTGRVPYSGYFSGGKIFVVFVVFVVGVSGKAIL